MIVKILNDTEVGRLNNFNPWREAISENKNNTIDQIRRDMQNKMRSVCVVEEGGEIIAAVNVSSKCTALGLELVNGAVHAYGLKTNDDIMTKFDVLNFLLAELKRLYCKNGCKCILISADQNDSEWVRALQAAGFSDILCNIKYRRLSGVMERVVMASYA